MKFFWRKYTLSSLGMRAGSESITTAGTAVTFSTALASANYTLTYRCYNASNDNLEVLITNKTAAGFTATPYENGTLEYSVTLNS